MGVKENLILKVANKDVQSRSQLEQYRQVLIEMRKKYFTQKEMAELLNSEGIQITQQSISLYLKKFPITKVELSGAGICEKNKNKKGRKAKGKKREIVEDQIDLKEWKDQKSSMQKEKQKVLFDLNKPF